MPKNPKKLLNELLALPRRTLAAVALAHSVLLGVALLGGLPYLITQAVLAAELVLLNLATIALYPERGVGKHVVDMLKSIFALGFVYFFILVTYGVASSPGRGNPLVIAWQSLDDAGIKDLVLSVFYVAVSLGIALWQVLRLPDPKQAWASRRLLEGAVTLLAMIFMILIAVSLGAPLVSMFNNFGFAVDANTILVTLMVITRFVFALVAATMPASELKSIAASPYMD